MRLRTDTRGQAIQVGAVLLFATLIVSYSTYQAFVVPDQNRQVEFKHNEQVREELQELRNAVVSVTRPRSESTSVTLGTQYPSRTLSMNPPAPTGSLRTTGTSNATYNLTLRNATGEGEVRDFWNGSTKRYPTGGLVYTPNYNEYDQARPLYYEATVVYRQAPTADVPLTGQRVVDDETIRLVTLNGSVSTTRSQALSLDIEPVSASTTTVTVRNDSANVTVAFPTRLSESRWEQLLDGEFTDQGGHVVGVRTAPIDGEARQLLIDLEPGVSYELQMKKVGIGTGVTPTTAGYVLPVRGAETPVLEGGTRRLVVQVRDRYNNPVTGVTVNASAEQGRVTVADETNLAGEAVIEYSAPDDVPPPEVTDTVRVSYTVSQTAIDGAGSFDAGTPANASVTLDVQDTDAGGNSNDAYTLAWLDPSGQSGIECPNGPDDVCEFDQSRTTEADLTIETVPTAVGAPVSYALNDSSIGSLDPASGTTDSNGQNETTLSVAGRGGLKVYGTSGEDSDTIVFDIIGPDPGVVFVSAASPTELRTVSGPGLVRTYTDDSVSAIGPQNADLNGGGGQDVPYVDGNDFLQLVDAGGNTETLDDSGNVEAVRSGVGDWDDDGTPEVVYVRNNKLYQVTSGGTPSTVSGSSVSANAVAGIADFDGDGDQDIVYADNNDNIAYYDESDGKTTTDATADTATATSTPADFDDDGDIEIAAYDGNGDIDLINSTGTEGTLAVPDKAAAAPLGALDDTDDGVPDIIYTNQESTPKLGYVDVAATSDFTSPVVGDVTDSDGNVIETTTDGAA